MSKAASAANVRDEAIALSIGARPLSTMPSTSVQEQARLRRDSYSNIKAAQKTNSASLDAAETVVESIECQSAGTEPTRDPDPEVRENPPVPFFSERQTCLETKR